MKFNCGRTKATAKEEESATRNAQAPYVIRFQVPLIVSSEEVENILQMLVKTTCRRVHVVLTNLCSIFSIFKGFLVWLRFILIQSRASSDRTRFLQWNVFRGSANIDVTSCPWPCESGPPRIYLHRNLANRKLLYWEIDNQFLVEIDIVSHAKAASHLISP